MERRFEDFWTMELAQSAGLIEKKGTVNPLVDKLVYDSREVVERTLFFALNGLHTDGHRFIDSAIDAGACVIVHETLLPQTRAGVIYLHVRSSRAAMSPIAAAFYGEPSRHLAVIGVTGTEGKSTTVYLIFQLLRLAGKKCGFISTVEFSVDGSEHPNPQHQTTPEASQIHRMLAEMLKNGLEYAVLESSSHGLSPRTGRLANVAFDVGVMTNVTHEHLEFHGTWECYRDDKANLFRALNAVNHTKIIAGSTKDIPAFGVVNAADPSARFFTAATTKPVIAFNTQGSNTDYPADFYIENLTGGAEGNSYKVVSADGQTLVRDELPGAFNAGNVLAALIVVSRLLNMPVHALCPLVSRLCPVRGRMTAIKCGQPFEVLVDYAHTPSSFEAIFPPLRRRLDATGGRIIALFGSAGERDTQKRPAQGAIASRWADIIVLCDEDPRGEDPLSILEDIAAGITGKNRGSSLFLIPERSEAVRKACSLARPGDLVLLLGKGHENSIIYSRNGRQTIPYDEITEAEQALRAVYIEEATS
ncbi:MAG: UDP-N-acetylmuramoyl-L-alanyl-D-glutamate--2,6-diaminopimelate ligase [Spirochaetaceae bacterium]|jgi:UDP-N-acetylmuramoyl-L-alanyl-D-glutamate--2,6-diaminopimelate ligase|nr:UDP-N-acetylmuramoyl-L-alanyl-D-glutamate--2,6-diaminopimelate ligase [Spirochaetaceae bacterium]